MPYLLSFVRTKHKNTFICVFLAQETDNHIMQQQNSNNNDNPNNQKKRTRNQIRNRIGDGFSSLSSSRSSTTRGRRVSSKKVFSTGRWDKSECEAFERGIQIYGKSNWTRIATLIPTR